MEIKQAANQFSDFAGKTSVEVVRIGQQTIIKRE